MQENQRLRGVLFKVHLFFYYRIRKRSREILIMSRDFNMIQVANSKRKRIEWLDREQEVREWKE